MRHSVEFTLAAILALMAASLLLCGCTTRTIRIGNATYTSSHFLTAQTVGEITFRSGTNELTVRQWSNDGTSAAAQITEAAVRAALQGVKP